LVCPQSRPPPYSLLPIFMGRRCPEGADEGPFYSLFAIRYSLFALFPSAKLPSNNKNPWRPKGRHGFLRNHCEETLLFAFGRPGSDLLSQVLRHSTIGAEAFNDRVRDGIGFGHPAIATKPAKGEKERCTRTVGPQKTLLPSAFAKGAGPMSLARALMGIGNENDQADRAISTGKLHALPHFHTRPINVVVYHGSQGRTRFEVGFPLRCLQRLSRPHIATLLCRWRDNRSTRGASIPVLSY
jgi:hypothetical protein